MNEERITLDYNLYDLPTAQHKAGLAGFLVMLDTMERRELSPIPKVDDLSPTTARISFSKDELQTLFDDLFNVTWVKVETKQIRKDKNKKVIEPKQIKEIETITDKGKKKIEKFYIYEDIKPKGEFLSSLFPDGQGLWHKLWQDMLWNTLRGKPLARNVYKERAEDKPSSIAEKIWSAFQKINAKEKKDKGITEHIDSTVYIGAQKVNPEIVPFIDRVEQYFLLNFWHIVSLIYVPREYKIDAKRGTVSEDKGFVVVIPEPSNLENFIDDIKLLLRSLDTNPDHYRRNRPKDSIINLPAEGALEYLYHLAKYKVEKKEVKNSLEAIELYHLEKKGNNVKTLTSDRIVPNTNLLDDYELIRKECRNPFYKSRRILNLLSGESWFYEMFSLFSVYPSEFFIFSKEKTPRQFSYFCTDAKNNFKHLMKGGLSVNEEQFDDQLASRIYRLIQTYVNHRSEDKSGMKSADFKRDERGYPIYPSKYREEREKVCMDAFLAMRGRREQDFIQYFTGTICSVPQFLPEKEYLAVTYALMSDWEKVKTLSMLALSAHSYLGEPRKDEDEQKDQ